MTGHPFWIGAQLVQYWYDEYYRPMDDLVNIMKSGSDNTFTWMTALLDQQILIESPHPDYFRVFFHPDVRI